MFEGLGRIWAAVTERSVRTPVLATMRLPPVSRVRFVVAVLIAAPVAPMSAPAARSEIAPPVSGAPLPPALFEIAPTIDWIEMAPAPALIALPRLMPLVA